MMKVRPALSAFLSLAVLTVLALFWRGHERFDEMQYRGKSYKLAKAYGSWEDFKSDPSIAPDQLAAVQSAVESGKLTPVYTSRWDMIQGTMNLMFPGFGMTTFGEHAGSDGTTLAGISIDIPFANKERVIVYRGKDDTWTLIDDFAQAPSGSIWKVDDKDGKLVYSGFDGKMVVTRELAR